MISGIDVSKYQGNIDWNKVKAAGYSFAFIRVGYANYDGTITQDSYYTQNMKNAIAAGVNVGCYVYSYITSESAAINCANIMAEKMKPYKITMPVAFDVEDEDMAALGRDKCSSVSNAFLNRIRELGYYPILYTYTNYANNYLNSTVLNAYDVWIADYRSSLGYKGKYTIWQYSSKGSVPGISGNCDMNKTEVDYPSLISGQSSPTENLSALRYRVLIEKKCQAFGSKNTNDVIKINGSDYLPKGDYKIVSKENYQGEGGFYWCEIRLPSGNSGYAVYNLPDNRCEIINATKDVPVENKVLNIIIEKRNQAFLSRNTSDIYKFGDSSYIPVGKYDLITIDTEPQEEGLYWCQFRYTNGYSYYAVYNLDDGRCSIEDKVVEPIPTPEPEPEPEPTPEPKPEPDQDVEIVISEIENGLKEIKELNDKMSILLTKMEENLTIVRFFLEQNEQIKAENEELVKKNEELSKTNENLNQKIENIEKEINSISEIINS